VSNCLDLKVPPSISDSVIHITEAKINLASPRNDVNNKCNSCETEPCEKQFPCIVESQNCLKVCNDCFKRAADKYSQPEGYYKGLCRICIECVEENNEEYIAVFQVASIDGQLVDWHYINDDDFYSGEILPIWRANRTSLGVMMFDWFEVENQKPEWRKYFDQIEIFEIEDIQKAEEMEHQHLLAEQRRRKEMDRREDEQLKECKKLAQKKATRREMYCMRKITHESRCDLFYVTHNHKLREDGDEIPFNDSELYEIEETFPPIGILAQIKSRFRS